MSIPIESLNNPWRNVYWFSRMLISVDKYGAVGNDSGIMILVAVNIRDILNDRSLTEVEKVKTVMDTISDIFKRKWNRGVKKERVQRLIEDLKEKIKTTNDCAVFALTCERIMVPVLSSLQSAIPNNDLPFTQVAAKRLLDKQGKKGIAPLISIWDNLGVDGCLDAERSEVIRIYRELRLFLENKTLTTDDTDIILTAFVQEFERRLGQKRKGRAGSSLEDLTSFILEYFHIPASHEPDHFTAGIEVDKWVRDKNGWYTGISCKRTLRERWKQAYTSDTDLLSRYKIKNIIHIGTFDEDLSDDKVTEMGSYRVRFYLPDDSRRYLEMSNHVGMKEYVKPLSTFVDDLQNIVKRS